MTDKRIEELSVLELKGVLFDLNVQFTQVSQLLQTKLKEEQVKEAEDKKKKVKEDK